MGGPIVKKKLLNIIKIKEKDSLKNNLFYNVEKLKTYRKRKMKKKKEKSDYLQSFNKSSFSFALKLSSDRSSLTGLGSSFQTFC